MAALDSILVLRSVGRWNLTPPPAEVAETASSGETKRSLGVGGGSLEDGRDSSAERISAGVWTDLDLLFHGSGIVMVRVLRGPWGRYSTGEMALSDPISGELSTRVVAGLAHSAGMLMGSPVGFWYVGAEMDKSPHRASKSALSSDLPLDGDGRIELRMGAMMIDDRNVG
jgi:hypothetical protein